MERRLSAILVADVVGYSRLIRAEEEGTIAAGGRGLPSSFLGLALAYHRPINSNFLHKTVGHVPVLLGHFD